MKSIPAKPAESSKKPVGFGFLPQHLTSKANSSHSEREFCLNSPYDQFLSMLQWFLGEMNHSCIHKSGFNRDQAKCFLIDQSTALVLGKRSGATTAGGLFGLTQDSFEVQQQFIKQRSGYPLESQPFKPNIPWKRHLALTRVFYHPFNLPPVTPLPRVLQLASPHYCFLSGKLDSN